MGQGHKQYMHTALRNIVYALAVQASAQPQLEPQNLIPTEPALRPADVLLRSTPQIRSSSWKKFPSLALDFAIVSPFTVGVLRGYRVPLFVQPLDTQIVSGLRMVSLRNALRNPWASNP